MERLSRATAGDVPKATGTGIVHLGLGAFHRAHQAVFTADAIAEGGGDWGIAAVAPRSRAVLDPLLEQDLLYSVLTLDGERVTPRVLGVHSQALHAASEPEAVERLLADPAVRIVTLTVTEKAYRPGSAVLDLLVRGLRARAGAPIALVSCDNLPSNGRRLRELVVAELGPSIVDSTGFPSTMVDRIVPASTDATYATARDVLGLEDRATVGAEPFNAWVLEDDFPGGRPAWDLAGAIVTDDVGPWEGLKLRVVLGVHSALAYLGALAGAPTIDRSLALPGMRDVVERFIATDIAPTLSPPEGVTVERFGQSALARFANSALRHRTLQVAMDGSQKLPQRLLGTIADRRAAGSMPLYATLVLAAWMRFVRGSADDGTPLPLDDPLADRLRSAPDLLALDAVFPPGIADDTELRAQLAEWSGALERHGVLGTLAGLR
ncbi:mannitol dehydrogenase family protein [Dactylosporangium sp. NPDC000244]|uniref:mannitol dehydrogenase family protein n=1 Tax=Dactylosporangium sp. NPDC000244 TaxID=3154365 RepID=UPI00331C724C